MKLIVEIISPVESIHTEKIIFALVTMQWKSQRRLHMSA